jgi:hypothetical protein
VVALGDPRCHRTETYFADAGVALGMAGSSIVGNVGGRPSELMLYRCLVCGFQSLKTTEITEHLMSHAEAAKYTFSSVIKD